MSTNNEHPLRLPAGLTRVNMTEANRLRAVEVAHRLTLSPHEWDWTQSEQAAMAHFCLWAAQRLAVMERIVIGEPWADHD